MFEITKEQRDALLQYLLTRPMVEVEGGVQMLRSLKEKTQPIIEEVKAE